MGAYVNPPDQTKEQWLSKNARFVDRKTVEEWNDFSKEMPVVHLDNGPFTAAGIAYCAAERDAFLHPDSGVQRPRKYFIAPIDKLLKVSRLDIYLKGE